MLVLNTTSPDVSPTAPKEVPSKIFPSERAKIALLVFIVLQLRKDHKIQKYLLLDVTTYKQDCQAGVFFHLTVITRLLS